MKLIRKFLGRLIGHYCPSCGEVITFDKDKWEAGYGYEKWCSNKKCKRYEFMNRVVGGKRK